MNRSLLVVFSNAHPGSDDEFNDWYDHVHLREIVELDGFVGATRLASAASQLSDDQVVPHRYLALYEIEGDPDVALEALRKASVDMAISPALDTDVQVLTYSQVSRFPAEEPGDS